jgi:hypothetical protein
MRGLLGRLATVWLLTHAATVIVVPAVLWIAAPEAAPIECTCAHGDHSYCPMHHTRAPRTGVCVMDSGGSGGAAVVTPLLGHVGIVPAPDPLFTPDRPAYLLTGTPAAAPRRAAPPDPPPPRA